MRLILIMLLLFVFSPDAVLAEALFVGKSEFVARGCHLGAGTQMIFTKIPDCFDKSLCGSVGNVSCTFISSKLVENGEDWKKVADVNVTPMQTSNGRLNWMVGQTGILCPPKNGSCDNLDLDHCANLAAKDMGCSLKNITPDFQTIPREKEVEGLQ